MKYNTSKEKFGGGGGIMPKKPSKYRVLGRLGALLIILTVIAALTLAGCRPHSGVVDTGDGEDGGGGSGKVELEPRLESITFDTSAVTLTTEFKSSVFMYTADLNGAALDDLTIIAESTDQASIISYLADGQTIGNPAKGSIFVIKVDSSDHTKSSTYIVHLSDSGDPTPLQPALLSGIALTSGEITSFDTSAPASYDVTLPYGTKTVAVSAITENPTTYFVSYDPSNIIKNPKNDDQIAINVVKSGNGVGTYVITFHIAAPLPSALTGISVSAGSVVSSDTESLVVNFNPNVTSYIIQMHRGAYTNMVVTGEVAIGDSVTYSPSNVISGTLDGKTITITVNDETDAARHIGYGPAVYTITVQENDKLDAKLTGINFAPDNGTLYKWSGGAKTTDTGFDENCTTYTYKMNSPASITVTGQKTDSAVTVSYGGYTGYNATSPLSSPSAAKPLSIFASGPSASHNATSYTVYFEWESAPLATLSSLSVPIGKFSNNLSTILNPATGNNPVTVPYGTSIFVVDAVPTNAGHIVTYSPSAYSNPAANDTITVTVNGGPDYSPSTYTVKATIAPEIRPRITKLIIAGEEVTLTDDNYYYLVALEPMDDPLAVDIPFEWEVNTDVTGITYKIGSSDEQIDTAPFEGFSGLEGFTLNSGASKAVLVTLDANEGVKRAYNFIVTRSTSSKKALTRVKFSNLTNQNSNWSDNSKGNITKDTYNVSTTTESVSVENIEASAYADVSYSLNGSSYTTWTQEDNVSVDSLSVGGDAKTLHIRVTASSGGDPSYYTFTFRRYASSTTYTYTGGAQTFTMPVPGKITFDLYGAEGGSRSSNTGKGGKGGRRAATTDNFVSEGTVFYVYVGQKGPSNSGGNGNTGAFASYGGGGKGGDGIYYTGTSSPYWCSGGAAGGGATFITTISGAGIGSIVGLENNAAGDFTKSRVLVAGGGGGGSGANQIGGNGSGGDTGINGSMDSNSTTGAPKGASSSAGFASGVGGAGRTGGQYGGGAEGAGGGGGGYKGGESRTAGGTGTNAAGGGGNGWSADGYKTNIIAETGVRLGNGEAIITVIPDAP
ncbi:MAG: hypothetical protein Ta2G_11470 [Termitinemataceae bacterium]|nr:MAG: hypothetical protein Ta2G_11470 [Termitinemataceae bacterium]